MASEDLKHLTSSEFVAGKPPDEQNKNLQEFVEPHIESFNYMLDEGLKNAVQVDSTSSDATAPTNQKEVTSEQQAMEVDISNQADNAHLSVDGNEAATTLSGVEVDNETAAALSGVEADNETAAALSGVEADNEMATTLSGVEVDNETATALSGVEADNEMATTLSGVEVDNETAAALSGVEIDNRTAAALSGVEAGNEIAVALTGVEVDNETAAALTAVEVGDETAAALSGVEVDTGNLIIALTPIEEPEGNPITNTNSSIGVTIGTHLEINPTSMEVDAVEQTAIPQHDMSCDNQVIITEQSADTVAGHQVDTQPVADSSIVDEQPIDSDAGSQLNIVQTPAPSNENQIDIDRSSIEINPENNIDITPIIVSDANQICITQQPSDVISSNPEDISVPTITDNDNQIAGVQSSIGITSENPVDISQSATRQIVVPQPMVTTTGNQLDIDQPTAEVGIEHQIAITQNEENVIAANQIDIAQNATDVNTGNQITINQQTIDVSSANQIVLTQPGIDGSTEHHLVKMEVDGDEQIVITQPSIVVGDGNHISISQPSVVDSARGQLALEPQAITVANPAQIAMQSVEGMQAVNGVTSEAETITINLPSSTIQNLQLNGALALPNSPVAVLQTDYMNILDIVLNNSKLSLAGNSIDGSQAIVLAEVERNSGEMIAVKGVDGHHIALTPQQLNALNVAAASGGGDLSIVTSEAANDVLQTIGTDVTNQAKNDNLIAAMSEIKENTTERTAADITMKDDNGDEIEFEEDLDDDPFEVPVNSPCVDGKSELVVDGRPDIKYKCNECSRPYVTKAALKKHLNVVHGKELESTMQKATSRCIHPGCEKIFYHRQKMIDHLKEEHGVNCVQEDLVFNSWDEFFIWKEKEEDANFVHFSKNSTHTNAANYMLTNFTCQREGKAGYKYKGSQQKKYKDLVIGEKICPARMRARLDKPTGRVTVQYCKSHNHKLSFQDFLYRRMPDRLRNEIREKLVAGMSSEEIYKELKSTDNLRENRGERFAPSKRQFVTLVNIKTIAKRMQIKETGPPKNFVLDPDPYAIQMQKLLDETYNPVLLYKDQGVNIEVGPIEIEKVIPNGIDLLLIGIQTKEQKEMFVKHGHKIVFIDITEAIVAPTQYVVTVKVLDEYNKGYPVAFLLSNSRDETVLFYFFREIQARVAESGLKINAVMTENSCNEYYAFRSVFGDHVKHLLCKWNLHRAWCQKIHEECAGDEALQQELYFIFVTMLEEQDLSKFESIATEFVNNYQARCPNFITFFMSNYLSQPEVWASCYRNNPFSDCDEILYGDRLHERIKKEIKNNHKVKSLDDILDLALKFEHEDYFNRGLNLMLNPPEGDLVLSEHSLGMKIKNTNVNENYTADNRWLVKTTKRDPSDLQNIKEESYIVTWKADICEKDFCRERCLKLTCFGLCGHLYHCSCDVVTVTPCSHIHKVHSLRIGVSQYQNEEKEAKEIDELDADNVKGGSASNESIPLPSMGEEKDDGKLNLINQVSTSGSLDQDNRTREEKIRKIKLDLVKMYKFLESDNIQKYSLDFIDAGLKKVIDECKIIDSIGQSKSVESFLGKRKSTVEDLEDFENLVKYTKRKKVMGNSVPVIVEIEPNPATYNTFRKRITGDTGETPEDRMLRLSKSKNITVNIESDDKFRKNQSQQVTSTPGIIVAKEGDESSLKVEAEEVMQIDLSDTEWTPRTQRKGSRRSKTNSKRKSTKPVNKPEPPEEKKIPPLENIPDPLKDIITNGTIMLNMTHLKVLDTSVKEIEVEKCKAFSPGWDATIIPAVILDSYFYVLSQKYNILSLTVEQMQSLCNNEPHITRFWDPEEIDGDNSSSYIFVPWRNPKNYFSLFVIDLKNHCITYLDSSNSTQDIDAGSVSQITKDDMLHMVNRAHTTLIGLMITEIPFDSTRVKQLTWPLTIDTDIELDNKDPTLRTMWYAHRLCSNATLIDKSFNMDEFRKVIYDNIVGNCLDHIVEDKVTFCPVCNSDRDTSIECTRCNQMYHLSCLRNCNMESGSFVCI